VSPDNSRRRVRGILSNPVFITCGLLLAAGLLLLVIPSLDGPHSRRLANEAAAASKLRTIGLLQTQYMAAHAYSGFACELPLLKPSEEQNETDDSLHFLTTGTQYGYKFSLVNCGSDANRARVHYQVMAIPVERGTTGFRAFCADESGVIWDDETGSATKCLVSRHAVQ
jgi:hypothetical protein